MYSLMSIRTMALASSNRKSASARASSVLPTPVGPDEQERADRPVGVGQAGPAAADGVGHGRHRLVLADHPGVQGVLHPHQLVHLALEQAADRHAGRPADDLGDVLGVDLFLEEALALLELVEGARWPRRSGARGRGRPRRGSRTPRPGRPRGSSRSASLRFCSSSSLRDWMVAMASFSGLPVGGHGRRTARSGWPAPRPAWPAARPTPASVSLASAIRSISSWRMRRLTTSISVGHRVDLDAQPAGRLVHQVDGLVGQEPAGHVAVGQHGRRHQGGVLDADAVVDLVALLQAAQDGDGVLDRGLAARRPAGSGARGRRPSRCTCGTRRGWWRRSCAARRGPASA